MIFITDIVTTTAPEATYQSNVSLFPNVYGTEFDSSGSQNTISLDIQPSIENLVANLEMDCEEEGKISLNRY